MNHSNKSIGYQQSGKVGLFLALFFLLTPLTFSLAPSVVHASLTDGLVPLEVQPASGLAVAIGDLLLTGLVGNSTFDGKDTNWGTKAL